MKNILDSLPEKSFTFNKLPSPIPPDLRPSWKIGIICLILHVLSLGNKASPKKLLTITYLLSTEERLKTLKNLEIKDLLEHKPAIRFDPSVDRAIDMGLAEQLFTLEPNKNVKLTEKGISFSKAIQKNGLLFELEKDAISHFSKKTFSERNIDILLKN